MKTLLLLIPLLPLGSGECPEILRGLDSSLVEEVAVIQLGQAIDTVCGKRNFTSALWNPIFYHQVMGLMSEAEYIKFVNCTQLKPVYRSLMTHLDAIENNEAKKYVNDLFMIQRKFATGELTSYKSELLRGRNPAYPTEYVSFLFNHTLPLEAQLALSEAFKRGFGWKETGEIRRNRVHAAMEAIERVGPVPPNEKMGEMYAKVFLLLNANRPTPTTAFGQFAEWAQYHWKSDEIGPLQVLPALETLYLQYANLKDTKAKKVIDWAIASFAVAHFNEEKDDEDCSERITFAIRNELKREIKKSMGRLENICASSDVASCFAKLPDASLSAIMTTFPELFEYFFKKAESTRWKISNAKKSTESFNGSTFVCPRWLQGVPTKLDGVERFDEAVDTACGRRNFTSAFWSAEFREQMLLQIVFDKLGKEDASFVSYIPLLRSLDNELSSMENANAKAFIIELREFQQQFATSGLSKSPEQLLQHIQRKMTVMRKHLLSTDDQIAIAEAMKKGFGIVETVKTRKCRIGRAMRAIGKLGARSGDAALARIFGHMFLLMKEEKKSFETSDFAEQVYSMETDGLSSEITAMQVVPAMETLYIQYATLKNVEAKRFADWVIGFLARKNMRFEEKYVTLPNEPYLTNQVWHLYTRKACPTEDVGECVRALSAEAKTALRMRFPELYAMLERRDFDFNEWTRGRMEYLPL